MKIRLPKFYSFLGHDNYEVENGSCDFVFKFGPQVCSGSLFAKHAVKYSDFPGAIARKCIVPYVKTRFHVAE